MFTRRAVQIGIGLVLLCEAGAFAKVRVFLTGSMTGAGLTPATAVNRYLATSPAGQDATEPLVFDADVWPAALPLIPQPPIINVNAGEYLYLWFRFEDEPVSSKVTGLDIGISRSTTQAFNTADFAFHGAFYRIDDRNGDSGEYRWQNTGVIPNPATMSAVNSTAFGLRNRTTVAWDPTYQPTSRTYLLGAFTTVFPALGLSGEPFPPANTPLYRAFVTREALGVLYSNSSRPQIALGAEPTEDFPGTQLPAGQRYVSSQPDAYVCKTFTYELSEDVAVTLGESVTLTADPLFLEQIWATYWIRGGSELLPGDTGHGSAITFGTNNVTIGPLGPADLGDYTVRVAGSWVEGNECFSKTFHLIEAPSGCAGDADCDGGVDFFDIDPFVAKLGCPGTGAGCDVGCPWQNADVDGDGDVDFFDIDPFVARLGATCP